MAGSNYITGGANPMVKVADGTTTNVRLDNFAGLLTSQTLPQRYELSRSGRIYVASSGAATAQASTATVPTTTAPFALWNGASGATGGGGNTGAISYAILGVGFWTFSGTFGIGTMMFGGVSSSAQAAAVSALSSSTVKSASGSTRTTAGVLGANITLAGTPSWMALGSAQTTGAAANLGQGAFVKLDGEFIVPPGYCFGVACVTTQTSSPLFGASILYAEIESYLV